LETKYLPGGAQIRLMCKTVLNEKLQWIDKCNSVPNKEIMVAILAVNGFEGNMGPKDAFQCFVKDLILSMIEPLLECADLVLDELKKVTNKCITEEIAHYPWLKHEMVKIFNDLWNKRCEKWKRHLEKHVETEASYINTDHEDFLKGLEPKKKDGNDTNDSVNSNIIEEEEEEDEEDDEDIDEEDFDLDLPVSELRQLRAHCKEVKKLIRLYFEIFLKSLKHHFRESLAKKVIYYAMEQLNVDLMMKLFTPQDPEKMDQLVQEAEGVAEAKQKAEAMINTLLKAKEIIENTRINI